MFLNYKFEKNTTHHPFYAKIFPIKQCGYTAGEAEKDNKQGEEEKKEYDDEAGDEEKNFSEATAEGPPAKENETSGLADGEDKGDRENRSMPESEVDNPEMVDVNDDGPPPTEC